MPERLRDLILSVGTHRGDRPFSPIEVAESLTTSLNAGSTPLEIARTLGLEDTTMITRFRRLLTLAPDIRHLVAWRGSQASISLTVASEIARLPTQDDQRATGNAALTHNLTSSEVRQIVQIVLRGGNSASGAIEVVLQTRPQIIRRHVFIGAVLSEQLTLSLKEMTQLNRDALLESALHRPGSTLPEWNGKLGVDQFTLVGDENLAVALNSLPGGFEAAINRALEAEVAGR
jgi:hypothetical protein